jgi:hypothetical protein
VWEWWGWVGGWLDQVKIRLTQPWAELGKYQNSSNQFEGKEITVPSRYRYSINQFSSKDNCWTWKFCDQKNVNKIFQIVGEKSLKTVISEIHETFIPNVY